MIALTLIRKWQAAAALMALSALALIAVALHWHRNPRTNRSVHSACVQMAHEIRRFAHRFDHERSLPGSEAEKLALGVESSYVGALPLIGLALPICVQAYSSCTPLLYSDGNSEGWLDALASGFETGNPCESPPTVEPRSDQERRHSARPR